MTKAVLLKKLETIIDEAERTHMYGLLEVQFSDGLPALIRKSTTEKCTRETNRAETTYSR
jgi:hypothetical protein